MKSILAVLLAAILLFGCTQPGGTQAGTGGAAGGAGAATGGTGAGTGGAAGTGATGGTTGGSTGGSTGGATGATGAAGGTGTETGGTDGGTGSGGESGGGAINLGEWSMEALIAMGAPVHCTIAYGGDLPGTFDMYVLGEKIMITGETVVEGGTQEFTEVIKPVGAKKMMYFTISGADGTGLEGCDWLSFDITETDVESEPGTVETTTVDYEQTPVSYQCFPDIFGDEKFATPGEVCDFSSIMQDPSAICNTYTGDEREQCLAAMG